MCHLLEVVEIAPPKSDAEARAPVSRMVTNGMPATEEELVQIIDHLNRTFVSGREAPGRRSGPCEIGCRCDLTAKRTSKCRR